MKGRSRVEQFEGIRRDRREEGLSIRALADRHGVHRRAVRQALNNAVPPSRRTPVRMAPVLGSHAATVRRWLEEDSAAPRKQRHTARRVWQRLTEEGARVAESSVRALVAQLRWSGSTATRAASSALKKSWAMHHPTRTTGMLGAKATISMPRGPPSSPMTIHGRRMPRCDEVRSLILPKNGFANIANREPIPATSGSVPVRSPRAS